MVALSPLLPGWATMQQQVCLLEQKALLIWRALHRQAPSYSQVIREAVGHIGPSELVLIQLPGNPVAVEPYQCGLQFRPTT